MTFDASTFPVDPVGKSTGVEAGPGFSLTDASGFENALLTNQAVLGPQVHAPTGTELSNFVQPLSALDKSHSDLLQSLSSQGKDMTYKELYTMMTTVGMYSANVTLVSSIASKTTEGLQQLFRQQS